MSNVYKKILFVSVLVLLFIFAVCVIPGFLKNLNSDFSAPVNDELTPAEERCIQAVQVYRAHEIEAKIDIYQYLEEAKKLDPKMFDTLELIFDFWISMNENNAFVNTKKAPEGLTDDDSLCIFTLGCGINEETQEPSDEAEDRLKKAYETWVTHQNAYIGVSGGKTGRLEISEGESMRNYLVNAYRVLQEKITVEDMAINTQQNCSFMYDVLNEKYPNINKVCIVLSDYHIKRCSILWQAMTIAANLYPILYNEGKESRYIPYVANVASDTNFRFHETIGNQGIDVERELFDPFFSVFTQGICPSEINEIKLNSDAKCFVGDVFRPSISADFLRDEDKFEDVPFDMSEDLKENNYILKNQNDPKIINFSIDVSQICSVDCDTSKVGIHKCIVTFVYMGKTKTLYFDVKVLNRV